jgi:hypothetical protein
MLSKSLSGRGLNELSCSFFHSRWLSQLVRQTGIHLPAARQLNTKAGSSARRYGDFWTNGAAAKRDAFESGRQAGEQKVRAESYRVTVHRSLRLQSRRLSWGG